MGSAEEFEVRAENRNRKGQWGKWKGKTCSVEGCEKPVSCRGFCSSHYRKAKWASGYRPPSSAKDSRSRISAKLKYRYGITLDYYERLLADQDGVCAICRKPPEESGNPAHWNDMLCVDHCHDTGAVRGLLCNHCNLILKRNTTVELFERAIAYIRLHDRNNHGD